MSGWRSPVGQVSLKRPTGQFNDDHEKINIPCGGCIGCRMDKARAWTVRCTLELQEHSRACWATLTYTDRALPPTLQKDHLSAWLKRLRARHPPKTLRFFASGEYGERTHRPHYHVILFGLSDDPSIYDTWPHGRVQVDQLTPAAIKYVAGYTAKKAGYRLDSGDGLGKKERIDPDTGEVFEWQHPFLLMSRRPGLASKATKYGRSWSEHALLDGSPVPVPRYLHDKYKLTLTPPQLEALLHRRHTQALLNSPTTPDHLHATRLKYEAQQRESARRRTHL